MSDSTFDPALGDTISQVRQLIGDKDVNNAVVVDATITAYLKTKSVLRTAAQLCRDIAAGYATRINVGFSRQQIDESTIFDHYMALAARYDTMAVSEAPATAADGTSPTGVPIGFSGIFVGVDRCRPSWSPDDTWGFCGWNGYGREGH